MDRLHFFFSFELSYLRMSQKPRPAALRGLVVTSRQALHATLAFTVQNGRVWS
jgi:hypothetical protein